MRYADSMDRPLSDDDRRWLTENNFGDVADRFDREDGVGEYEVSETEEETPPRVPDYSKMTVPELKAEIGRRNEEILEEDENAEVISVDGNKSDLIDRLKKDDEAVAASE